MITVESVEIIELDEQVDVYDIEVEKDNSFSICGIVAHNSNLCRSLDGREFPVDEGPRPAFHIGCRSTTSAVLNDRLSFLSSGRTRSSRGDEGVEQVPAKQTYYDWLKGQPDDFQAEAIGKTRAKLLRDGGLSAERFAELSLGKNFQPATLETMKRLEPLAFEKANLN